MERQLKLLITAEDEAVAAYYTEELQQQGIAVICCEKDGAKALEALREHRPDAALLHLFMPGLDALAVKESYDREAAGQTVFYAKMCIRDRREAMLIV